jgi:hypothetical protein
MKWVKWTKSLNVISIQTKKSLSHSRKSKRQLEDKIDYFALRPKYPTKIIPKKEQLTTGNLQTNSLYVIHDKSFTFVGIIVVVVDIRTHKEARTWRKAFALSLFTCQPRRYALQTVTFCHKFSFYAQFIVIKCKLENITEKETLCRWTLSWIWGAIFKLVSYTFM